MNVVTTTQLGLTHLISQLQKQKEQLTESYHEAITKGEKLHDRKILYLSLKDVDKKLNDLLKICSIIV